MTENGQIRVLWTTNIVLPGIAQIVGVPRTPFGGWLVQMLQALSKRQGIVLGVAMLSSVKKLTRVERDGVVYFALPKTNSNDIRQSDCERVLNQFKPDILHAQGSELAFTRRFFKCAAGPKILSMQGILNGIAPYQLGCLSLRSLLNPMHPRDALVGVALWLNYRLRFRPRLEVERQTFLLADYVIGRTNWDRAHSSQLNSKAEYRQCAEIMRPEFHGRTWSPDDCEPQTIFIGSSASPLKGVHIALRAIALLKRRYSDIKVYIAGSDPRRVSRFSLRGQLGYQAYLLSLISRLALEETIHFTGELMAEEMAERLCNANVYLLPSLIENSPNTLCEAMLMGVPSVAAYVGGVPSIANDNNDALLYRANDPVMLAFQIQRLFDDRSLCRKLSSASRIRSIAAQDIKKNVDIVNAIYRGAVGRNAPTQL